MFHDVGKITIPPDGVVSMFSFRFPCKGMVWEASIRLLGVPLNSGLSVVATANGEQIFKGLWPDGYPLLKMPDKMQVDDKTFLSIQLSREGGEEDIVVNADLAYLFQEHARAEVQRPAR